MLRIEQLRAEIIDRFERVDRRFAQQEQRLGRIDQRLADAADRLEAVRVEIVECLGRLGLAGESDDHPDGTAGGVPHPRDDRLHAAGAAVRNDPPPA